MQLSIENEGVPPRGEGEGRHNFLWKVRVSISGIFMESISSNVESRLRDCRDDLRLCLKSTSNEYSEKQVQVQLLKLFESCWQPLIACR